jgi:DNA-binding LacI/PurR family transcriptional regulator
VKLLAGQIDGTVTTVERLLFEPELVVRGSTAPPAARANVTDGN